LHHETILAEDDSKRVGTPLADASTRIPRDDRPAGDRIYPEQIWT
jgi:hypothetical protein